jgi:hypothetical protein
MSIKMSKVQLEITLKQSIELGPIGDVIELLAYHPVLTNTVFTEVS